MNERITVKAIVDAPIDTVWEYWTEPTHIMQWNNASPDWHTPRAENDLKEGGTFTTRMEAKDGTAGFTIEGTYTKVIPHELIEYTMNDGRTVSISFKEAGSGTSIEETFEAEQSNPIDIQRRGWQAILDNFAEYAESNE